MVDDPEIDEIFFREARSRIAGLLETLRSDDADSHYALFRHAHSLKGIADMTGHTRVAELAGEIVGRVRDERGNPVDPSAEDEREMREDVLELADELERAGRLRE